MLARVAVCELPDSRDDFASAWSRLVADVEADPPDVLLLNEAPFDVWFARDPEFDADQWRGAVENHQRAMATLDGLGCAVIATAPVTLDSGRHNQVFTFEPEEGVTWWRRKAYLPNEEPVFEAAWYDAAYDPPDLRTIAGARVGVLTCTEIWRMEWASQLGQLGAQIIATPRATGDDSLEKWFAAGRVAAVASGAFSLSSNRSGGRLRRWRLDLRTRRRASRHHDARGPDCDLHHRFGPGGCCQGYLSALRTMGQPVVVPSRRRNPSCPSRRVGTMR